MINFENLQTYFYRAFNHIFVVEKLLVAFFSLAACGLTYVFFKSAAMQNDLWAAIGLEFIGALACVAWLLVCGVFLVRLYHNEIKGRESSYKEVLMESWHVFGIALCCVVPLMLGFVILWFGLGAFLLIGQIPYIGQFLLVILAWAPFLIYFAMLLLIIIAVALLFVGGPALALKNANPYAIGEITLKRFLARPFYYVLMSLVAILPLVFISCLLTAAACTTLYLTAYDLSLVSYSILLIMIALPACLILAPFVVFFFNFATETYVHGSSEPIA